MAATWFLRFLRRCFPASHPKGPQLSNWLGGVWRCSVVHTRTEKVIGLWYNDRVSFLAVDCDYEYSFWTNFAIVCSWMLDVPSYIAPWHSIKSTVRVQMILKHLLSWNRASTSQYRSPGWTPDLPPTQWRIQKQIAQLARNSTSPLPLLW